MAFRGWSRIVAVVLVAVLAGLVLRASLRPPDGVPPVPAAPADSPRPPGMGVREPLQAGDRGEETGPAILGIVVDGEGKPIQGAEVASARDGERVPVRCESGPDGRFRIPVSSGEEGRLVGARAAGYAPLLRGGVRPGGGEVRLVLHPGARLEGLVRDSSGAPCAGARVRAALRFPGVGKDLGGFEARADEEGRFAFDGLAPVEGRLEATFHGCGSEPVDFAIPAGERLVRRDIVLPAGPTIEGIVRSSDGAALHGITVAASTAAGRGGAFARTGPDGRFVLRGLESLAYSVRATDYQGRWLEVRLEGVTPPCKDLEMAMKPDPDVPGAYRFRVEAPAGSPPRAVRIREYRADETGPCGSSTTAPDGEGRVGPRRMRAGRYRLDLRCPSGTGSSEEFTVEHGATVDLGTIRLGAPAAARGRLLDASGAPSVEARIFVGEDSTPEAGAVGPDGTFELRSLPAGSGRLRAVLARCEPIVIPWRAAAGETADLGDLRFRAATGAIRGSVRSKSGASVGGARIRVSPWDDFGPGSDSRTLTAGPDGRFEAPGLAAGRWGVSVSVPASPQGTGEKEEDSFVPGERSLRLDLAEGGQEEIVMEVD